jgi:hypothetical protein
MFNTFFIVKNINFRFEKTIFNDQSIETLFRIKFFEKIKILFIYIK